MRTNRKMQLRKSLIVLLLFLSLADADFKDHFKKCYYEISDFDVCVREGLNMIQSYYKTGLPEYKVLPFDPFYSSEVSVMRGNSNFGFILTLRNLTETGWSASKVTKFVSDLKNYKIIYTQSFPEKVLTGNYEFKGTAFSSTINVKGQFTLTLYDLIQMTTVTKFPGRKVQAQMNVQKINNLNLHIIIFGKKHIANILNNIIRGTWQSGFIITRGLINELVSTAFTEIFDKAFHNFPFDEIFKARPYTN